MLSYTTVLVISGGVARVANNKILLVRNVLQGSIYTTQEVFIYKFPYGTESHNSRELSQQAHFLLILQHYTL